MKYLVPVLALMVTLVAGCGSFTEQGWVFRTADPALSILVPYAEAPLLPTVTPDVVPEVIPEEEIGEVVPDPTPVPPCEIVKGNISRDGRKLYHVEGMANFDQVKISEEDGELFFCSPEEAEAAGWVRAGN